MSMDQNLPQRILSLLPRRILGFSLVGGSVMVGGIMLLFVLVHMLHIEQHIAYLIQAVASIETNFFLNRFMNWRERDGNLFAQWIKFHSTSAVTFPLNQALFAVLTGLGINYLIVTVMGAGIAAIVNYIANDRFVFHRRKHARSMAAQESPVQPVARLPLPSLPCIAVVIPVRNSQRTIRKCVESVLHQDYRGTIAVFVVGNPPEQDKTWQALNNLEGRPFIHRLQVAHQANGLMRDSNQKRYEGAQEALRYGADVIAFLDSQVEAPPDWLSTGVRFLREQGVDGVAGKSCRHPQDRSFPSVYQDASLFTEWPEYGAGFVLCQQNFAQSRRLPITANLILARRALQRIGASFPNMYTLGWDDFRIAWAAAQAGCRIFCTDQLRVYRNHKQKFRLAKQFSSGISGVTFYRDNPQCPYVQRRLLEVGAVMLSLLLLSALALLVWTTGTQGEQEALLAAMLSIAGCMGVASTLKARDWRGLLFPLLDVLHVGLWVAGALYGLLQGGSVQPSVAQTLERLR
jgi:putative flippase GtrA/GT2 family glycosyltransferase